MFTVLPMIQMTEAQVEFSTKHERLYLSTRESAGRGVACDHVRRYHYHLAFRMPR